MRDIMQTAGILHLQPVLRSFVAFAKFGFSRSYTSHKHADFCQSISYADFENTASLVRWIAARLIFRNSLKPNGPYVDENDPNIVIGEGITKSGHATCKAVDAARVQRRRATQLGVFE